MNKKLVLPSVAVIALAGTLFLTSNFTAHAQETNGQVPQLVQEIADKFHLDVSAVKAVFEQNRQNRLSQMEQKYEDALIKDVADGKITDAQKQLILAKHKKLMASKSNFADWKNLTPDQRKAKMQQQKTDLQTWTTQNGIDLKYLMGGFAMRNHMGKWMK